MYDAFVDEDCKQAFQALGQSAGKEDIFIALKPLCSPYRADATGACMLSNNSFPYIQSDSFIVQSQTDQTVLTGHDNFPQDYMYK